MTGYDELRASLAERKNWRRAKKIDDKLPAASAALGDAPRRKHFAATEEGRREWRAKFNEHAGEFSYAHVGAVTARINHGHVGMFGNYLEREGHGVFVEWQRSSNPRSAVKQVVVPLRDADTGQIKVPDAEAVAEYVMVMAVGDTTAYATTARKAVAKARVL